MSSFKKYSQKFYKNEGTSIPKLLTILLCLSQSLGVCVCSDSWAGPDCSVPRDSNSLVWDTLLDTQLTVVTYKQTYKFFNPSMNFTTHLTKTHIHIHCYPTEPGPQVLAQDGPLSGVWTTGQPLDVWRALFVRGHSGKRLQVGTCKLKPLLYCLAGMLHCYFTSLFCVKCLEGLCSV